MTIPATPLWSAILQPAVPRRDPASLWDAQELVTATGGRWLIEPPAGWFATGVGMARNHLMPGDLFVCMDAATWRRAEATSEPEAIKEAWDTAQDLGALKAAGASATVVQRDIEKAPKEFAILRVDDSIQAIFNLAAAARGRFKGKAIGITGTVGKTATREMLKYVLGLQGKSSGTTANFNTRVGVPYSLAQTPPDADYAVFEMSAGALYAEPGPPSLSVLPHVAVITGAGLGHASNVPDPETTARYASRIFHGLAAGGTAVINRDTEMFPLASRLAREYGAGEVVSFGAADEADIRLREADMASDHSRVTVDVFGQAVGYEVPIPGKGMIMNSLACLAAARAAGADWRQAAADLAFYRSRTQTQRTAAVAPKTVNLVSRHGLDMGLVGDTYFGEFYQEARKTRGARNYLATRGYDYSVERFTPFLQSADFVIANLEATLTNQEASPFNGAKDWILRGDPARTLAALKVANVGAAALGNNHTFDYGQSALGDTLAAVTSAGMLCFGAGRSAAEAVAPLEINLSLAGGTQRLALFSAYQYARDFDEALKGYARGPEGGIACIDENYYATINSWKAANPDGVAIAFPHWGRNYMWRTSEQRRIANRMIDAGIDLIVGHGAHMMQEIEMLRGRWAVYSLGNGYFGSEGEYARRNMPPYSFLARLNCSDRGGKPALSLRLYPIVSDNQKTRFQPRFATVGEFRDVNTVLEVRSAAFFAGSPPVRRGRDEFGWHIELPVSPA